jgi:diguanylate cyclase (GGDEF)-like protein
MSARPVVLVADDSFVIRAVLREHLEEQGYAVVEAADGEAALALCRDAGPDALLLDVEMPGRSGHEVLAALQADADLRDIPVVFLTGHSDTGDLVKAIEGGAHDYLRKPFEPAELLARVRAAVRVKSLQDELKRRNAELDLISRTDVLTGLYNRRHLEEHLGQLFSAARRHGHGFAVVMLDIDHFKTINDSVGHAGGDIVLREVAARVRSSVRREDIPGRWGGEEFLLLLPFLDADGTRALGERLRTAVAATPVDFGGRPIPVTVSLGGAAGVDDGGPEALVRRADAALYAAKHAGRNRVEVAGLPDS